jgi:hypothetical protein
MRQAGDSGGIASCWHSLPTILYCNKQALAISFRGQYVHYMMGYPRSVVDVNVSFGYGATADLHAEQTRHWSFLEPRQEMLGTEATHTSACITAREAAAGEHGMLVQCA